MRYSRQGSVRFGGENSAGSKSSSKLGSDLLGRSLVDLANRFGKGAVEILFARILPQVLEKRSGEAGDYARVLGELLASVGP